MFIKYKKLFDEGLASHLCDKLGEYILIYGGTNFKTKYEKQVHNTYFIYDLDFNLVYSSKGNRFVEGGIKVKDEENEILYHISGDKIYKLYIENQRLYEEEIGQIEEKLDTGFGCIYKDNLIFGRKNIYSLNLKTGEIVKKKQIIPIPRNQSVFARHEKYMYILGGATNIAYLDSYRYDLDNDTLEELKELPFSLLGSEFVKMDDDNLLIMGGFDKEVFEKAVIALQDPGYKKIYFELERASFNWNKKIIKYSLKTQEFKVLEEDINSAVCSGTLIRKDEKTYYLVLGEEKPGARNKYVYKFEEK